MKLTLGISPCPNDTFIFDALINHKIDTEGIEFDVSFADIEQLNNWSFESRLDITKVSFNAYTNCIANYILMNSGSALGKDCGPILVKKPNTILNSDSLIAIPGRYTTAKMLLDILCPKYKNKTEVLFSDIMDNVILDNVDAGLIIHESRFLYHEKGLEEVLDLGKVWEENTGLPIPLGGIVVRRDLSDTIKYKIQRIVKSSVEYAFRNKNASSDFVKLHSQEMNKEIIDAHINLYVNEFTISLGKLGRKAVSKVFEKLEKKHQDYILDS
tara:strand:+ start:1894 stop:2703 length:810 start_codon:yes stop_codon:yes gene_type:complete